MHAFFQYAPYVIGILALACGIASIVLHYQSVNTPDQKSKISNILSITSTVLLFVTLILFHYLLYEYYFWCK